MTIRAIPSETLDVGIGIEYVEFGEYKVNNNFKGEPEEMTIDADETEIYNFGIGKVSETNGTYTLESSIQ